MGSNRVAVPNVSSLFCAPRFVSFVCRLIYQLSMFLIMLHIHAGVMLMQLAFLVDLGSMACLMQVSCQFIYLYLYTYIYIWPSKQTDDGVNVLQ